MKEKAPKMYGPCESCGGSGKVEQGSYLRWWREQHLGLSLRALAQKLGYSAAYICDVELGRRRVTPAIVEGYKLKEKQQ